MKKTNCFDRYSTNWRLKKILLAMKLSIISILVFTLQVSASVYSQTQKFDLSLKNVSVKDVFKAIEAKSDFRFFYNDELSDVNRVVSVNFENMKVEDVLSQLFKKSGVTYKVLENNLIVITPTGLVFQKTTITGIVTDQITKEPLPGVNITVEGTTLGTVSDASGKYSIDLPSTNAVLLYSFVGYNTERVETNGRSDISMELIPDIKSLEEVVVIGYGSRSRKDVTTSIATVSSNDIRKEVSTSAEFAMMGRMAGVSVSGATGDPLSRPTVRIRGVNTWGVADPLYVIDGIPVTEAGAGADAISDGRFGSLRGSINIMTLIDPNDIESISVLKDAAAAAVYGVRAANGVVLITTKQGKKGDKPSLEFNARYGIQNVHKNYEVMNIEQLVKFKEDAYKANSNFGEDKTKWNELNPASPNYVSNYKGETVDWQKAALTKNAPTQEYNLRLSGGTDRSVYTISGGYANSESLLAGKTMNRYSFSTNVSSKINNWLNLGGNYRLAYVDGKDNDIGGFDLNNFSQMPPWQPIYDPDGYLGYASSVKVNSDGMTGTPGKWSSDPKSNRLGQLATQDYTYGEFRNMGSVFGEIEIIKGLKARGTLSGDYYKRNTEKFTDYNGWQFDYAGENSKALTYLNSVGSLDNGITENFNFVKEFSLNYNRSFGNHNIDVLFNAMDQKYTFHSFSGSGKAMTTLDKGPRFVGNMEDKNTNVQTDVTRNALQGYLGRLSYNYMSKYYLDFTLRRDGSSKFSKEKQWGTFPGVAVAWRISGENFLQEVSWLNDLKLRAGRGSLGNMEVRDLAWAYIINPNPAYSWGSSSDGQGIYGAGAALTDMANPDLSWEKTTTTSVALDFTVIKGLSGSIEYYDKLTDGIIQQIELPASVGYKNTPFVNLAQVSNKGYEFTLNYQNVIGDLSYSIGGNLTTVKNTVEKTFKNSRYNISNVGWVEEGKSIGYERGYKFGGIYQTDEDALAREAEIKDNSRSQKVVAGDAYFLDVNGVPSVNNKYETPGADGKLDSYDQVYLWNNIAPLYYGLNIDMRWKGLDFSALFNGVGGTYGHWDGLSGMGSRSNGTLLSARDSWTPENNSSWLPRNVYGDPNSNLRGSDRDKHSRSYLRMQTVQLGYTLPKQVNNMLGNAFSNLRVYASVNNLITFTRWPGLNPDGSDVMPYIVNFGINAKF